MIGREHLAEHANERQRRLQLVRDRRDEVTLELVEPLFIARREREEEARRQHIRDERARWIKRMLFQKGMRNVDDICAKAGIIPLIAQSAIDRQTSVICKKPYKMTLPQNYRVENGF